MKLWCTQNCLAAIAAVGLFAISANAQETAYMRLSDNNGTVDQANSYNPAGQTITATRTATGKYTVRFPGATWTGAGIASALGTGAEWCKIGFDNYEVTGYAADIACYNSSGAPTNSKFSLVYVANGNDKGISYAWAQDASAASYTPDPVWSRNASGGTILATRFGTGSYQIRFNGLTEGAGSWAGVWGYSDNGVFCQVSNFGAVIGGGGMNVNLRCVQQSTGASADSQFTVMLIDKRSNQRGLSYLVGSDPQSAAAYTPSTQWLYPNDNSITSQRISQGNYKVTLNGAVKSQINGGNILISPYTNEGGPPCSVVDTAVTGTNLVVNVFCFSRTGVAQDAFFTMMVFPPEIIHNGGFELPLVSSFSLVVPNAWKMLTGTATEVQRGIDGKTALDGQQWVELDANANTAIYQDITTIPGRTYRITYAYSTRQNKTSVVRLRCDNTPALASGGNDWSQYSTDCVATGNTMRISFEAQGTSDGLGDLVDAVDVALLPVGGTPKVTISTIPAGRIITVDGVQYGAPQDFNWTPGSQHSVGVDTQQFAVGITNTRYIFSNWNDGFPSTHTVTAPNVTATLTAQFTTQYQLTTNASGLGSIAANPAGSNGFYDANTVVALTPTGSGGQAFNSWSGDLTGSANPGSITMSGPKSVTANFGAAVICNYSVNPATLSFTAAGNEQKTFTITTTPGCQWTVSELSFAKLPSIFPGAIGTSMSSSGTGTVTLTSVANAGGPRSGTIAIQQAPTVFVTVTQEGVSGGGNNESIPFGSSWKYLVTGTDQGSTWRTVAFNDSAWSSGAARIGFGDTQTTTIGYGPDANNKYVTTYFRKTFNIANPAQITAMVMSIIRDDGAVVYVNGNEVVRSNMPSGAISWGTFATTPIADADETAENIYSINPSFLVTGTNVIAVEIHQSTANSSDLGFDLKLSLSTTAATSGLKFVPMNPCRLVDTRTAYAAPRTGAFGPPLLNANTTRTVPINSSQTCSVPPTAKAYVLNVTLDTQENATGPVACATLWPTGEPRPDYCTARTTTGGYIANASIVRSGTGGSVDVWTSNSVNLIVDINGYFTDDAGTPGLLYYPVNPCRAVDTRGPVYSSLPPPYGQQRMQARENRTFRLPGSPGCALPAASAYSLQLTLAPGELTNGAPVAYITAYPTGVGQPIVSSMNAYFGYAVANSAIVPASANGSVDVFALDPTNLIVDVNGYFAADDGTGRGLKYYPTPQCRLTTENDSPLTPTPDRTVNLPSGRCPGLPSSAQAYALNAAVVPAGGSVAFLSMWPSGTPWPNISQLNAFQGQTVANSGIVPASANGSINVRVAGTTPVILEVGGYFGR